MEQNFFDPFLEVICVDTVSHTTSDKCPLLAISGRGNFDKIFIILKALLSNERSWVF